MPKIKLTKGYDAIVDEEDFATLSSSSWYAMVPLEKIYAANWIGPMHRAIMGEPPFPGAEVDHINGNSLDNRRANQANSGKRRGNFTSKFRGVHWNKQRRKWQSEIRIDYKRKHLGFYIDEIKAAHAYNNAATKYFGEFARLNILAEHKLAEGHLELVTSPMKDESDLLLIGE